MFRPQPFACLTADLCAGKHHLLGTSGQGGTHVVKMVALAAEPDLVTMTVRAHLTECAYPALALDTVGSVDATGLFTLTSAPSGIWTSDGVLQNFHWICFFNSSAPNEPLIAACIVVDTAMSTPGSSYQATWPGPLLTLRALAPS